MPEPARPVRLELSFCPLSTFSLASPWDLLSRPWFLGITGPSNVVLGMGHATEWVTEQLGKGSSVLCERPGGSSFFRLKCPSAWRIVVLRVTAAVRLATARGERSRPVKFEGAMINHVRSIPIQ